MTYSKLNNSFHQKSYPQGKFTVPKIYLFLQNEIISCGEDGICILAHDKLTHQNVLIRKQSCPHSNANVALRSHQEFVLSQILYHKNIAHIHNIFTTQKFIQDFKELYFVMDYMKYPLSYLIQKKVFQKENSLKLISYLVYQLLCGVRHFHKAGIVHKDLSPNNVYADQTRNGQIVLKIMDFGKFEVKNYEDKENISCFSTPRPYRAPEEILGIDKDLEFNTQRKIDVWSIGCILVEMLLGEPLFKLQNNLLDHWNLIIEIFGSPSQEFTKKLPEGIRNFVELGQKVRPIHMEKVFPDDLFVDDKNSGPKTMPKINSKMARDFLSKVLIVDPEKRLSVEQALEHPFVNWSNEPGEFEMDKNPKQYFVDIIGDAKLDENEWKTLIYSEVKQYETMKMCQKSDVKIHDCEKCVQHKCECHECNKLNLDYLLKKLETNPAMSH